MPIFPTNPTDQQEETLGSRVFRYDAASGRWNIFRASSTGSVVQSGGATVIVSTDDLPADPANGQLAYNNIDKVLYIWDGSAWADPVSQTEVSGSSGGAEVSYTLATDYNNLTLATQGSGPGGNGPGYVSISEDGLSGSIIAHDVVSTAYMMTFSTAFDASTVSFTTQTIANVAHAGGVRGARFSRDGLHLLLAPTDNLLWHYTLSTPYDVTSVVSSQSASITGFGRARLEWQSDGLGILGNVSGTITHVPLSTAYDITTAGSSTSQFFHSEYRDIFISMDGTYMVVYENNGGSFRLVNMTTPYDISTGTSTLVSNSRWYYINTSASTYLTADGTRVLTQEETKTRIYNI